MFIRFKPLRRAQVPVGFYAGIVLTLWSAALCLWSWWNGWNPEQAHDALIIPFLMWCTAMVPCVILRHADDSPHSNMEQVVAAIPYAGLIIVLVRYGVSFEKR